MANDKKSTMATNKKRAWEFVYIYHPNYSSKDIARSKDLAKLVNGEYEWGDNACKILELEYGGDDSNPHILIDHNELLVKIYEAAIEGYFDQL